MARLWSCGFELQSALNGIEFDTANGTAPTIQTTTIRGGVAAMRTHPTAATSFFTQTFTGTGGNNTRYVRAYLNIATTAGANGKAILLLRDNTNGNGPIIQLNTDRSLTLFDAQHSVQIGSNSSALSLNTWYRIELNYTYSTGAISALVDGSSFASGTTNTSMDMNVIRCGVIDSDSSDLYWDDIAINDSTGSFQNSFPGAGQIITLKPNAAGDVNTFATQTGGTAGSGNNFTRVNEVTPDDATSFNGSSTLNQEDLFNMDNSGIGGSDTVNVVQVNGRFRNSTADATAAIKFEIEKTASGTISQSSAITPNSTSWFTNATAVPKTPTITLYNDPDGSAWTQTTLDSMQAGYKLTTGPGTAGRRIDVTKVWVNVDYTPASGTLHTLSVSGTYSASGAITRAASRSLTASYSGSGAVTRFISRQFNPSYTTSGLLTKRTSRTLSSTYSASGVLATLHQHFMTLTATFSSAGNITKYAIARTFGATYSASGSITKLVGRSFVATYTNAGNIVSRAVSRPLTATYSASGSLTKILKRTLTSSLSASGSLVRSTVRNLSGTYRGSGSLLRLTARSLSAIFDGSGLLNKNTARAVSANYSASGSLAHKNGKIFVATHSASGNLSRTVSRALSGLFSVSGVTSRLSSRFFSSSYGSVGNLNKQTTRPLSAVESTLGSLVKQPSINMSATYSSAGSFSKMVGRTLTATFMSVGSLTKSASKIIGAIRTFLGQKPQEARISMINNETTLGSSGSVTRISTVKDDTTLGSNKESTFLE